MDIDRFIANIEKSPQHQRFYHFTDRANLDMIRSQGGLLSMKKLRSAGVSVPVTGGNEWSLEADRRCGMDEYVHLCFTKRHPMLYICQKNERIKSPVWLRIALEVIRTPGSKITLEVSNKSGVTPIAIDDAIKSADWEVVYKRLNWNDSAIRDRLRVAEKYELLIPNFIPIDLIEMPNG